jgi:hypothetical protein
MGVAIAMTTACVEPSKYGVRMIDAGAKEVYGVYVPHGDDGASPHGAQDADAIDSTR